MVKRYISRLVRFLKKPSYERNMALARKIRLVFSIPFLFGHSFVKNVYLTYQPDSFSTFNQNKDFFILFRSFIQHNKHNNAGDIPRLWFFILNIQKVIEDRIEGDFAELGVWRGNTASVLAHYALRDKRKVYLFDTYEGFNESDLRGVDADKVVRFDNTSIDLVSDVIGEAKSVCEFVKGYFPQSLSDMHRALKFSIVSLDCDLYEPMAAGLTFFYPLMPVGGMFLLHDYSSMHWVGAKKAVDEFCDETGEFLVLMPDKSGSAVIRKSNKSIVERHIK